jgi:hypothetical protein
MPSTRTRSDRSTTTRPAIDPRYGYAAGLVLAALMLIVFYAMVRSVVQKAETDRESLRVAGQREAVCRGTAAPGGRDLCMLSAAVPAKLGISGGSQVLGPVGFPARAN